MMFAQANSEHCRHKIFNADWVIDGEARDERLFGMIKSTTEASPGGVISAYSDNAAASSSDKRKSGIRLQAKYSRGCCRNRASAPGLNLYLTCVMKIMSIGSC